MVSKKFEHLGEEDLNFLDEILKKESTRQENYNSTFKTKNKYSVGSEKTKRISKLRDAIRSQKNLVKTMNQDW